MGVEYQIPEVLNHNESIFLQTLRPKGMFNAVNKYYREHDYGVVWEERIEDGVLGIRVWRTV